MLNHGTGIEYGPVPQLQYVFVAAPPGYGKRVAVMAHIKHSDLQRTLLVYLDKSDFAQWHLAADLAGVVIVDAGINNTHSFQSFEPSTMVAVPYRLFRRGDTPWVSEDCSWTRVVFSQIHEINDSTLVRRLKSLASLYRIGVTSKPLLNGFDGLHHQINALSGTDPMLGLVANALKSVSTGKCHETEDDLLFSLTSKSALSIKGLTYMLGPGSLHLPGVSVIFNTICVDAPRQFLGLYNSVRAQLMTHHARVQAAGDDADARIWLARSACHREILQALVTSGVQERAIPEFRVGIDALGPLPIRNTIERAFEADDRCSICLDQHVIPMTTSCGHCFCFVCIQHALDANPSCPECRATCAVEDLSTTLSPGSEPLTKRARRTKSPDPTGRLTTVGQSILESLATEPARRIVVASESTTALVGLSRILRRTLKRSDTLLASSKSWRDPCLHTARVVMVLFPHFRTLPGLRAQRLIMLGLPTEANDGLAALGSIYHPGGLKEELKVDTYVVNGTDEIRMTCPVARPSEFGNCWNNWQPKDLAV
jgi:hypothetical protein